MSNSVRAGIIAFVQSIFPVLILAGVNLSDDAIAGIMLVITNAVTLLALIFPGPKEEIEVVELPQEFVRESVHREERPTQLATQEHDPTWVERHAEA